MTTTVDGSTSIIGDEYARANMPFRGATGNDKSRDENRFRTSRASARHR